MITAQILFASVVLCVSLIIISHVIRHILGALARRYALQSIPGPSPSSFYSGSLDKVFHPDEGLSLQQRCTEEIGGAWKIWGPFGDPQIYLSDPRGLEHILLKNAENYEEPLSLLRQHMVYFGDGVGSATGKKHKKQRRRIGPLLSVSNLRRMEQGFYEIALELRQVLHVLTENGKDDCKREIDVDKYISRAALEFVVRTGMGYSFGKLDVNMFDAKNIHPYLVASEDLAPQTARIPQILLDTLHPFTVLGTPAMRKILASLIPIPAIKEIKRILRVLDSTVQEILDARSKPSSTVPHHIEGSEDEQNLNIISELYEGNEKVSPSDWLSEEEIIGQINSLIFAAHDTTSGALTRVIQVLSLHQDVQTKLREEILQAQERKMPSLETDVCAYLTYDELHALPYLDAVCREVLRLYPPVTTMPRTSKQDDVIPLEYPVTIRSGMEKSMEQIKHIKILRGTQIYIGLSGSNQDARTWGKDAHTFKPERWLVAIDDTESKSSVRTQEVGVDDMSPTMDELGISDGGIKEGVRIPGVWANLMTFLGGPRSCMGMRFTVFEMKVFLSVLLSSFRFTPSAATARVSWQNMFTMKPHVEGDPIDVHRVPVNVSRV